LLTKKFNSNLICIADTWSAMIYYYGPISILLLFNITLFVLTAWVAYVNFRDINRILYNQADKTQKRKRFNE